MFDCHPTTLKYELLSLLFHIQILAHPPGQKEQLPSCAESDNHTDENPANKIIYYDIRGSYSIVK